MERVINANGSEPLSESGMGMTQHSAIWGCVEIACSMAPVL